MDRLSCLEYGYNVVALAVVRLTTGSVHDIWVSELYVLKDWILVCTYLIRGLLGWGFMFLRWVCWVWFDTARVHGFIVSHQWFKLSVSIYILFPCFPGGQLLLP